jgi:hypothetical protein
MKLPIEVRFILFQHIMGSQIYPKTQLVKALSMASTWKPHVDVGHNSSDREIYGARDEVFWVFNLNPTYCSTTKFRPFSLAHPNVEILYLGGPVGKQIQHEAFLATWEGSYKYFIRPSDFEEVMGAVPPHHPENQFWKCDFRPDDLKWLTRIELNFTTLQYFEFFGLKILPQVRVEGDASLGPLLKGIATLKDLRLRFRNPREYRYWNFQPLPD